MTRITHTQCPKCASLGNDRGHDNLAVYPDGSSYCFSCGFFTTTSRQYKFKEKTIDKTKTIRLPADVDGYIPEKARNFLGKFELTPNDCLMLWSESKQRLIFPIFSDKELLAWQGRYLGTEQQPKWLSYGDLNSIYHFVGNKFSNTVVLTEDLLSAIKVGKACKTLDTMPIFGSHISAKRLLHLKQYCAKIEVYIWLDKDKQKESIKFTKLAQQLGLKAYSIITDKDPKEYNEQEINKWLYKS